MESIRTNQPKPPSGDGWLWIDSFVEDFSLFLELYSNDGVVISSLSAVISNGCFWAIQASAIQRGGTHMSLHITWTTGPYYISV